MENTGAWEALPGKTPAEKLGTLGIMSDAMFDIRTLDEISRTYGLEVFLFFEEDLARRRTLESVLEEYSIFPEYGRPYISIGSFLTFTRENDPSFEQTMREFPLMVEIVNIGEMQESEYGKTVRYVTGLMPFLDELDVDADPVT
jgi:FAD/FMN-containing dehydrogenase